MKKRFTFSLTLLLALMAVSTFNALADTHSLVVYSARNEHLIKPLFDLYSQKTGVSIRYITDKSPALIQRLKAEGPNTPADILLTVDAGNLWRAAREGLLQPVSSPALEKNIPSHLRDPQGRWFGFSVRARTIAYNTQLVDPSELTTYEDLADPKWKGRLCLRTSKKVYNQSLVAMLMAQNGEKATEEMVRGWVANLATDVFSNDTKLLEAIAAGQCQVGIVNTYYYGRLMKEKPDLPLALFWPDQDGNGVHVNVSGGGLVRHAKNEEEAVRFLEWLSTSEAQRIFADLNMEYPADPSVSPHPTVASWGSFKASSFNLSQAGELQAAAIMLMDRAGYR
ncbi:iron(III) transport system substrate-binding protein [Desulfacinum infernum DSM 9756]|uniref:Iron(III) transport system substrate-binding protein n=1 Tax=Desulfacinum infernum DSM 9756 TaxID=1121391 RepID=A0A1M5FX54_9BACT|nr:Fe(3+) ABC transporter substrate-binding protein [Desulfacinum infernum]SHF96029.1 iron(III) transport system substrate-binding protein [Desulfacinum infernum DSM 9756]